MDTRATRILCVRVICIVICTAWAAQRLHRRIHRWRENRSTRPVLGFVSSPALWPSPYDTIPHQCQDTAWKVNNSLGNVSVTVQTAAPFSIHSVLHGAGVTGDPLSSYNEIHDAWVRDDEWTASTSFDWPSWESSACLYASRIDTEVEVSVDGVVVLRADNMFRSYDVPLGPMSANRQDRKSVV